MLFKQVKELIQGSLLSPSTKKTVLEYQALFQAIKRLNVNEGALQSSRFGEWVDYIIDSDYFQPSAATYLLEIKNQEKTTQLEAVLGLIVLIPDLIDFECRYLNPLFSDSLKDPSQNVIDESGRYLLLMDYLEEIIKKLPRSLELGLRTIQYLKAKNLITYYFLKTLMTEEEKTEFRHHPQCLEKAKRKLRLSNKQDLLERQSTASYNEYLKSIHTFLRKKDLLNFIQENLSLTSSFFHCFGDQKFSSKFFINLFESVRSVSDARQKEMMQLVLESPIDLQSKQFLLNHPVSWLNIMKKYPLGTIIYLYVKKGGLFEQVNFIAWLERTLVQLNHHPSFQNGDEESFFQDFIENIRKKRQNLLTHDETGMRASMDRITIDSMLEQISNQNQTEQRNSSVYRSFSI